MRIDKQGNYHTLEEDIQTVFKEHGLIVIKETVKGNVWTIEAETKKE